MKGLFRAMHMAWDTPFFTCQKVILGSCKVPESASRQRPRFMGIFYAVYDQDFRSRRNGVKMACDGTRA